MNFSAILDISSFFIGMIINLLLIALICYYFKRKYENLEIAQNEQAKILYQLLQQNSQPRVMNLNDILDKPISVHVDSQDLESNGSESDDSDSDSESENEIVSEIVSNEVKFGDESLANEVNEVNDLNEVKEVKEVKDVKEIKLDIDTIDIDEKDDKDYGKMTIKQLKEILTDKGIAASKLKKNEMIELIEKSSVSIDE